MLQQPVLSPVPRQDLYALLEDYRAVYGDIEILVPEYFVFDGASIPALGWLPTYTPFHPDVMAAAIVHDWLYLNHQVDRKMADDIFYDRLIQNGAGSVKSKLMFQAVRLAGGPHWEQKKQDIERLEILYLMCKSSDRFDEYHFPVDVITANAV